MGDLFAKLLVFEGELVDGADESGDVGTELLEFLVLVGDRFLSLTTVARRRASTSGVAPRSSMGPGCMPGAG
jgi:hypothetical protein